MSAAANVVEMPRQDEPEVVQIDLQKDDVVRMLLGTPVPWAPGSEFVTMDKDLVRGTETPRWNEQALRQKPMQFLLQLYSDINWTKENPLDGLVIVPAH